MNQLIAPLLAAVPIYARPVVLGFLGSLNEDQQRRIALHMPIAISAAKHPDPEYGEHAFRLALDAMGIGLFAPQLWPHAVRYATQH